MITQYVVRGVPPFAKMIKLGIRRFGPSDEDACASSLGPQAHVGANTFPGRLQRSQQGSIVTVQW